MASLSRSALLPQCSSCIRRVARLSLGAAHQTRSISKAAKDAERLIIVRLLKDVPRYGRAGSLVPLNRATMRNRWFPARVADYVPFLQLKALKAQDVDMQRDPTFGVEVALEEADDAELDLAPRRPYVRPIEIEMLSPERSMELIDTFIPASIDFTRQRIELDVDAGPRPVATGAAAVLTAAAMGSKPKANPNAIYGSVTTADVVATLKAGLAHNDEAARVILNEADVRFVTNSEDADAQRVKELGVFRVEIQVPGAEAPLVRNVRVKAKDMDA